MKKLKFTLALACISFAGVNAQTRISNMINTTNGGSASLVEKIGKKESENATGSPYTSKAFSLGNVSGVKESILVKYNAESDEMEINNGDDKIFVLPKEPDFSTVTFKNTDEKYILSNYKNSKGNEVTGYLIEKSTSNDVALLKREKIILIPEKQPTTSYSTYIPPKYERANDEYYLQLKDKSIIPFPKNKKKLQEIFPAQKDAITNFFKTNDYSFKDEADMAKITAFIGTL